MRWSPRALRTNAQKRTDNGEQEKKKEEGKSNQIQLIKSASFHQASLTPTLHPHHHHHHCGELVLIVEEFPGGGAELRHRAAGLGGRGEPDPC
jgi:hypothetical protein